MQPKPWPAETASRPSRLRIRKLCSSTATASHRGSAFRTPGDENTDCGCEIMPCDLNALYRLCLRRRDAGSSSEFHTYVNPSQIIAYASHLCLQIMAQKSALEVNNCVNRYGPLRTVVVEVYCTLIAAISNGISSPRHLCHVRGQEI